MLLLLVVAALTLLAGSYLFVEGLRASRNGQHNAAIVLMACLQLAVFGAAYLLDHHWATAFVFIGGAACLGVFQHKKRHANPNTLSR
jgi:drug/metabolite transporter superfamily protein YnfA